MDHAGWRLEIRVSGVTGSGARRPARREAAVIARHITDVLGDTVEVESDPPRVTVITTTRDLVEQVQDELDAVLKAGETEAVVRISFRLHEHTEWVLTQPSYRFPRTGRAAARRRWVRHRPRLSWSAFILVAAAAGGTLYGLSPGVGSYQVGFVLMLPLLIVVLLWLHRRLPQRLQWAIAIVLAVTGPAGYLVVGGSQWWAWGQAAVVPVLLLVYARSLPGASDGFPEPWYGGPMEGPWGPP